MRIWPVLIAIPLCGSIAAHLLLERTDASLPQAFETPKSDHAAGGGRVTLQGPGFMPLGGTPEGAQLFARHCAGCHGWRAEGGPMGPPIASSVSSDRLIAAIQNGVGADAGGMPPVADVSERDAGIILRFLRAAEASRGGF